MGHVIEPAATGRSKCRACGRAIAKGELRFGEQLPNPFADGFVTLWFHLTCGAYRRPASFLETTSPATGVDLDLDALRREAERGIAHHRLPRINGVELALSARARCRACRKPIAKAEWRIPLVTFDDGMFSPAGNIHASCARAYFGTDGIFERLYSFAPGLGADERRSLRAALGEPS
jgi:hypothetical protein